MENQKNYIISANIDEKMNKIILKIKEEITQGVCAIKDWDAFIETAILIFDKMIKNDITPFLFDSFIESCKKNQSEHNIFDA